VATDTLAIAAAFVRPGAVGGAEQALYALVEGLDATMPHDQRIDVYARSNFPRENLGQSRSGRIAFPVLPERPENRFALDGVTALRARNGSAILFPNYFTPPAPTNARRVTIIHDLQYLHYPENFSAVKRAWLRAAHEITLRTAHTVVAISEFVRQDIVRAYGARWADRVTVIPCPIQWRALGGTMEPDDTQLRLLNRRPFVLSVGAHYRHKNLETLVRAFARFRRDRPDYCLVLVGQKPGGLVGTRRARPLDEMLRELDLTDHVLLTGFVSNAQVAWFYQHARVFAFPSLFEGMGRPPIEALGAGLPVLTTNRTSIPEMTRSLATYVEDPLSAEEMASWLVRMCDSPKDYAPTAVQVEELRDAYAPETIGRAYRGILYA
jgi:glycosyltransferase involved in cell wall biosynthesis